MTKKVKNSYETIYARELDPNPKEYHKCIYRTYIEEMSFKLNTIKDDLLKMSNETTEYMNIDIRDDDRISVYYSECNELCVLKIFRQFIETQEEVDKRINDTKKLIENLIKKDEKQKELNKIRKIKDKQKAIEQVKKMIKANKISTEELV